MENSIVIPHKPIFYKKYVEDLINLRKKREEDPLFKKLNNYHPKIKLTIQINPPNFLDIEIIISNNKNVTSYIENKVNYLFLGNLKFLSIANVTLLGELHPAKKISSNFQKEVKNIIQKFFH